MLKNTDEKVFHIHLITVSSVNASILQCYETYFVTSADIFFLSEVKLSVALDNFLMRNLSVFPHFAACLL